MKTGEVYSKEYFSFREDVSEETKRIAINFANHYYEYASQFKTVEPENIKKEIERRQALIISEPDGQVRETMIQNLLIDL